MKGGDEMPEAAEKKPRKRNDIKGTGQGWRKGKLKYTADEIMNSFAEYLRNCADANRKPTWEGYAGSINISSQTLLVWLNAKEEENIYNPDVQEALKKVQDCFADNLQQRTDAMAVFSLKQPRYGGYTDKQVSESTGKHEIDITINGI